jgi:hypothetical protein
MGDSHDSKPGSRPDGSVPSARTPAAREKPTAPPTPDPYAGQSGRVVHDERGNAVWDWIKDTARIAVDSTSRLLKRLEVPELKVEDTQTNSLSLEADRRDAGGGYDPYGSSTPAKGFDRGGGSRSGGFGGSRGGGNASNPGGGGYDPYGKGITRKPGRKP